MRDANENPFTQRSEVKDWSGSARPAGARHNNALNTLMCFLITYQPYFKVQNSTKYESNGIYLLY